jgi:hypothetical protein
VFFWSKLVVRFASGNVRIIILNYHAFIISAQIDEKVEERATSGKKELKTSLAVIYIFGVGWLAPRVVLVLLKNSSKYFHFIIKSLCLFYFWLILINSWTK